MFDPAKSARMKRVYPIDDHDVRWLNRDLGLLMHPGLMIVGLDAYGFTVSQAL
jgi:hypothetical protein